MNHPVNIPDPNRLFTIQSIFNTAGQYSGNLFEYHFSTAEYQANFTVLIVFGSLIRESRMEFPPMIFDIINLPVNRNTIYVNIEKRQKYRYFRPLPRKALRREGRGGDAPHPAEISGHAHSPGHLAGSLLAAADRSHHGGCRDAEEL